MTALKSCTVRLSGGDGYCAFFAEPLILRHVDEDWFTGTLEGFGEAMLFKVAGGRHDGRYVAFTSHVTTGIVKQLRHGGWASVVVHDIKNPTSSFTGRREEFDPCGMSAVELLRDR